MTIFFLFQSISYKNEIVIQEYEKLISIFWVIIALQTVEQTCKALVYIQWLKQNHSIQEKKKKIQNKAN